MDSYMQGSFDANHDLGFSPLSTNGPIAYTLGYLNNRCFKTNAKPSKIIELSNIRPITKDLTQKL